jgi:hypothetical protein
VKASSTWKRLSAQGTLPDAGPHLASVGEDVALELDPDDVGKWEWWGDFESDIEVVDGLDCHVNEAINSAVSRSILLSASADEDSPF